jgi:hypothetical protein
MIYKLLEFIKEIDQLKKLQGISSNMIILVISINFKGIEKVRFCTSLCQGS